jgi:transglutaminase-like putative cysteine protease
VISPLHVLVPEAPGESVVGYSPLTLDISNTDQGYLTAISDSDSDRTNLQLITPDGTIYSYFIEPGEQAVVPFTGGNGDYQITCYQQIDGTQYAALYMETIEVNLENEFLPFLYPNQYVNFTPDTKACQLALSMLPEDTEDIDVLDAIYLYVTENITYDEEKAENIDAGYLPDIDDTLETGTGICFDYAALITAMLRCRGIPCKLQIGYAGTVKHAWIDVYIRSRGWVDKAISFDGDTWTRMDPTFDSNSQDKEAIRNYIGDGTNYNVQFTR